MTYILKPLKTEPCLEHPDYLPPKPRKKHWEDVTEALDDERRGFGFDPDKPYWDGGGKK